MMILCGGSPLICVVVVLMIAVFDQDVGEIHRVENDSLYSRSPLSEPVCLVFV